MSANADAISNQTPPTGSHVPPSEPMTTKGHQVGQNTGPSEFHAQVLPAGTTPASKSHTSNPISETPGQAIDNDTETKTSASDTITGASSADVHTGMGHPGSGQSSAELHDNSKGNSGLKGVGAESAPEHGLEARDRKDFSQVGSHGASETKQPGQKNTR